MARDRISLNLGNTDPSVVDGINSNGYSFGPNDDGVFALHLQFPGVKAVSLTAEDLVALSDLVCEGPPEGSNPSAVARRTARWSDDGCLTARFSTEARSRSFSVPADQQLEVAALLLSLVDRFDDFISQFNDANEIDGGEE